VSPGAPCTLAPRLFPCFSPRAATGLLFWGSRGRWLAFSRGAGRHANERDARAHPAGRRANERDARAYRSGESPHERDARSPEGELHNFPDAPHAHPAGRRANDRDVPARLQSFPSLTKNRHADVDFFVEPSGISPTTRACTPSCARAQSPVRG
jgi:hypothetical protein